MKKKIWKPNFSCHFVETKSKQMLKPFARGFSSNLVIPAALNETGGVWNTAFTFVWHAT